MEKFYEIVYQGHKILMFDHRSLRAADFLQNLKVGTRWLKNYPENNLLTLADFTGSYVDKEVLAYLRSDESKQASQKVTKAAAVGVSGIKKIFLNVYNAATGMNMRIFDDVESAKRYLIS